MQWLKTEYLREHVLQMAYAFEVMNVFGLENRNFYLESLNHL